MKRNAERINSVAAITSLLGLIKWRVWELNAARNTNVLILKDGKGARQEVDRPALDITDKKTYTVQGKRISILVLLHRYDLQHNQTANQDTSVKTRNPPVVTEQGQHKNISLKTA